MLHTLALNDYCRWYVVVAVVAAKVSRQLKCHIDNWVWCFGSSQEQTMSSWVYGKFAVNTENWTTFLVLLFNWLLLFRVNPVAWYTHKPTNYQTKVNIQSGYSDCDALLRVADWNNIWLDGINWFECIDKLPINVKASTVPLSLSCSHSLGLYWMRAVNGLPVPHFCS